MFLIAALITFEKKRLNKMEQLSIFHLPNAYLIRGR